MFSAVKCGGWDLTPPKMGTLKCSFDGLTADTADICILKCQSNYVTETELIRCMATGGWSPTKNPTCEGRYSAGSME